MARSKKLARTSETEDSTATPNKSTRTPSPSGTRLKPPTSPESERPVGPLSVVSSQRHDIVKVNTGNATELKHACDDAVKRVRGSSLIFFISTFFCTYFLLSIKLFSTSLDLSSSSKTICTRTFVWDLAGWAFLLLLEQRCMVIKWISNSPNS